jgi:hypothetical protein
MASDDGFGATAGSDLGAPAAVSSRAPICLAARILRGSPARNAARDIPCVRAETEGAARRGRGGTSRPRMGDYTAGPPDASLERQRYGVGPIPRVAPGQV